MRMIIRICLILVLAGAIVRAQNSSVFFPSTGGAGTSAEVIALWTGTCNSSSVLGGDGACVAISSTISPLDVAAAGVRLSGADGVLTFLGLGNGNDESLFLDLDNEAANAVAIGTTTGVTTINLNAISNLRVGPSDSSLSTFGFSTRSDGFLRFSSSSNGVSGTFDIGLARAAAGVLRVSDGSSGFGRIAVSNATPTAANDACTAQSLWADANFVYVCTASGAIKRVAIATW